jgi:hypothetical protein
LHLTKELISNVEKHRVNQVFRDRTNLPEKDDPKTDKGDPLQGNVFPPNIDCSEVDRMNEEHKLEINEETRKSRRRKEQYVEDLQAEIFDHCMRTEVKNLCKSHYFESVQTDVNEKMRAILVDWLVDVHAKFSLSHQTLFMAVNVLDRYLEVTPVPRTQLQLVGIAALFLASKYEEIYPPDLKEFVKCCDNTYTAQQILQVESQAIQLLEFNLVFSSCFHFFELFSQKINFEGPGYHLGLYLLYLSTLEFIMAKYRPSIIAMSAIYLSNKFLKLGMWHADLPSVIGGTEQEIKICALDLFLLVQKARKSSLTAVPRKFSVPKHHHISQIQVKL